MSFWVLVFRHSPFECSLSSRISWSQRPLQTASAAGSLAAARILTRQPSFPPRHGSMPTISEKECCTWGNTFPTIDDSGSGNLSKLNRSSVGSAPLDSDGHVNCLAEGTRYASDSWVLGPVAYLDLTGRRNRNGLACQRKWTHRPDVLRVSGTAKLFVCTGGAR